MKLYVKGKLYSWDIEAFLLCSFMDMVNNIFFYQSVTTELNGISMKKFGFSLSAVLHLTKYVYQNKYFIFFDNYVSTFNLMERLQ